MHRTRLVPPQRPRWKIRDAARELGRTVDEALNGLAEIGEYANGPRDWIEEPVFNRLAVHFGVSLPTRTSSEPTAGSPEQHEPVDARGGLTPPAGLPTRNNHPYVQPEPRPRDLLNSTWVRHKPEEDVREYHAGGMWLGSGAPFADQEWALRGFTDAEKDVWLAAGLKDHQAKLAERFRDAGLSPHEVSADLSGWTVLTRVNLGEDVAAVVRLYQRTRTEEAG